MFQNILIPTDFSPAAWKAIQVGVHVGRLNKAHLELLHVHPNPTPFDLEDEASFTSIKSRMEHFVNHLVENNEPVVHSHVRTGSVYQEMIKFMEKHPIDLVIMGINGNGMNNEMGTNTAHLLEKSQAPIMVVPNLKHESLAYSA